jgi:hypothetical protein
MIVAGLWGCGPSTGNHTQHMAGTVKAGADMNAIFTKTDAEKILGEPARFSDSATRTVADTIIFQSSYTAVASDKKSGKTGNVYFMYEQYKDASTAHDLLAYYQKANKKNGAESVAGMGDEAWSHTDGQNFYFIMVRKGNKMMRMKVNKVTANTSLTAFKVVAKEVVERM